MTAEVKKLRNHPSVLIWSIENEITFINSRNLGLSKTVEPQITRAAQAVMAIDPTRPVMVDGGNCLLDESLPVNGVHYQESFWRDYPDEAYTLAKAYQAHEKPLVAWGIVPWRLVPERPIFMGEAFYVRGNSPAAFSQFAGEGCFTGWGPATRLGAGLIAKMIAEGHRWHGVAAHHFCFNSEESTDLHFNSWKPVCVFCRQWNWTFGGGSVVPRTLKVFNDTHLSDPIEMAWQLRLGDRPVAGQQKVYQLAPGQHEKVQISVAVPRVSQRTAGQFILTCSRGGKEVFREVKNVAVLPPDSVAKPSLSAGQLAVLDPHGAAKARLQARGIAFTEVTSVAEVPAQARMVLVGKDALLARDATDPRWLALASRGVRVLVLEQTHSLHFQALPADLTPTDYVGRVAFLENPEHPLFAGLDQPDFFTWSGDHVVYRNVYKKATRGAVSLAHCDEQLGSSAIAECPVNEGLLVLCQMVVGEKLATDPVAQRLFDNLLLYGERYALVQKNTVVVMDPKSPALKLLTDSGLKFDAAGDLLATLGDGQHQIVVFDATPENLKTLAGAADRVKAFTAAGGWLMAWGLPSCVMLAGPGARGQLPKAVPGLRANCKADVLFFLHTFNRTGQWQRGRPTDPTPVLFKYVVHYADGERAEVPVLYGEGADHWLSKDPAGLKTAALAWAAPFPTQKSEEQAVVYQFTWNNPRPKVAIATIDLEYGDQGSRYGTPALLAITAATKAE